MGVEEAKKGEESRQHQLNMMCGTASSSICCFVTIYCCILSSVTIFVIKSLSNVVRTAPCEVVDKHWRADVVGIQKRLLQSLLHITCENSRSSSGEPHSSFSIIQFRNWANFRYGTLRSISEEELKGHKIEKWEGPIVSVSKLLL